MAVSMPLARPRSVCMLSDRQSSHSIRNLGHLRTTQGPCTHFLQVARRNSIKDLALQKQSLAKSHQKVVFQRSEAVAKGLFAKTQRVCMNPGFAKRALIKTRWQVLLLTALARRDGSRPERQCLLFPKKPPTLSQQILPPPPPQRKS